MTIDLTINIKVNVDIEVGDVSIDSTGNASKNESLEAIKKEALRKRAEEMWENA